MMIGFARLREQPGDGLDLVRVGDRAGGSPSRARRRTRPGSRRRGTGRPGAATAPPRRCPPGRSSTRIACGQRGEQLLGPVDPVEEPGHRPERVVDGGVGLDRVLQLLQHRALPPGGVGVARQQQHRQPVDRRQRRPPVTSVQRTRADRGGDGEGRAPLQRLGVADGQVRPATARCGPGRTASGPTSWSSAWPKPATLP